MNPKIYLVHRSIQQPISLQKAEAKATGFPKLNMRLSIYVGGMFRAFTSFVGGKVVVRIVILV